MAKKRGNTYHLRMRVPDRYRHVEPRKEVWIALGTDSQKEARLLEPEFKARQIAEWEAKAGVDQVAPERYRRLVTLAAARGFVYKPATDLADDKLDEILRRIAHLDPEPTKPAAEAAAEVDQTVVAAVLGGVETPVIRLSGLVEYIENLDTKKTENKYKNAEQMRLWRSPRLRAVSNLRKALVYANLPSDIPIEEVTHETARKHHLWWGKRLASSKLSVDTAEKDYSNMSGMIRDYWNSLGKQSPKPYSGLSHRDRFKRPNQKPEFTVDWIRENIAAPGAMRGLGDELQAILQIVVETGARQSEIYNTPPGAIVLDAPIPYIAIEPEEDEKTKREIKNVYSIRRMPLVGIALESARRFPNGFPTYRGNSNFSAAANKWFRENKRFPSARHTVGGLRHSFESRMKAIGLDNEDRGSLMGHSRKRIRGREVYGDDLDLEMRHCVAMLIGIGPLVDGPEREAMARRLRRLLEEERKREE